MTLILGCTKCGKSDEGMNIIMFKGNPLCDDCFTIECPPVIITCAFCKATVTNPIQLAKSQPLCDSCSNTQRETVEELKSHMDRAKAIDDSIQVRSDVFNAKTVAIVELKKAIDANPEITNKPYALAETLRTRFDHLKTVVFEMNEKLVEAGNEQKAIQVYLNNLANTLRSEEREKLRIADINYKPNPVKQATVKSVKTSGTSRQKATKKEIALAAKELGIAEFTLSAFVLQSGGNLEVAVNKIKASLEAAKRVS
jgi:hypothetical protein